MYYARTDVEVRLNSNSVAMCLEWVTPGRNMRSGSSGSASCSMVLQRQERVADFVVVNKKTYSIVGEIKPEPDTTLFACLSSTKPKGVPRVGHSR